MGQFGKRHKIMPIPWACPVFLLANFTLAWFKTNIEIYDIQFLGPTLDNPYL